MDLPSEIWAQIFHLAADEDIIFRYGLCAAMDSSTWARNAYKEQIPESDMQEWQLRTPMEALNMVQQNSYATKKAIISTCRLWHRIGSELLFRCLFFNDAPKLVSLCETLDSSSSTATTVSSSMGWWTRRIHLARYHGSESRGTTMIDLENALVSVIRHCPNLEIFIVDWPMGDTFGPVADALATYSCKSLRTVHWNVPCKTLPKVIWALDSLPYIIAAHIQFGSPLSEDADPVHLGSASDLRLNLPNLQQLSLRGYFQEFLEQATGWSMPSLRHLTFDCGTHRTDQPDAVAFLEKHGAELVFLDLNCIPPLDVRKILSLCPMLSVFCFNADWRIQQPGEEVPVPGSSAMATAVQTMSVLVNDPHPNISAIGLHGLMYAFGIGYAADYAMDDPLTAHIIRRSNDLNIAALNRINFPKLQCVRALSRAMLSELNEADGPSEDQGGVERYDKWWHMLTTAGIRLEDCTGQLLGTLPMDDGEEDSDDSDSDDDSEEEDDDEDEDEDEEYEGDDDWEFEIPPMPVEEGAHVNELRQLLEECRAMEENREESVFAPMFGMMTAMGSR